MRKLLYILFVACFFTSCFSDDSNVNTNIVGKWTFDYSTPYIVDSDNPYADRAINLHIRHRNPEFTGFIFTADGKVKITEGIDSKELTGTYTTDDNKLTIIYNDSENTSRTLVYEFVVYGTIFVIKHDLTGFYTGEIPYLLPDIKDLVVKKVVIEITYTRDLAI